MTYQELQEFDYPSEIEKQARDIALKVFGEAFIIEINHETLSADIYKKCLNGIQTNGAHIIIRSFSTVYSDSSTSGSFSEATEGVSIYVAVSKIYSQQNTKNLPRRANAIVKKIWGKLSPNPISLPPKQICYFKKKQRKTLFNNEEMDMVQLDLSIKYMEY